MVGLEYHLQIHEESKTKSDFQHLYNNNNFFFLGGRFFFL